MQAGALPSGPRQVIDPIPDNLVREPIEYLFADHVRQRSLCRLLKSLAEGVDTTVEFGFADILAYLEREHSIHMADEAEELFPRLRARFKTDNELLALLKRLEAEHERDAVLGLQIADGLRELAGNPRPNLTDSLRTSIRAFVSGVTAHLLTEDANVLPLARSALDNAELEQMGRAMARRRGIDYPM